jgi:hypothetical protein
VGTKKWVTTGLMKEKSEIPLLLDVIQPAMRERMNGVFIVSFLLNSILAPSFSLFLN